MPVPDPAGSLFGRSGLDPAWVHAEPHAQSLENGLFLRPAAGQGEGAIRDREFDQRAIFTGREPSLRRDGVEIDGFVPLEVHAHSGIRGDRDDAEAVAGSAVGVDRTEEGSARDLRAAGSLGERHVRGVEVEHLTEGLAESRSEQYPPSAHRRRPASRPCTLGGVEAFIGGRDPTWVADIEETDADIWLVRQLRVPEPVQRQPRRGRASRHGGSVRPRRSPDQPCPPDGVGRGRSHLPDTRVPNADDPAPWSAASSPGEAAAPTLGISSLVVAKSAQLVPHPLIRLPGWFPERGGSSPARTLLGRRGAWEIREVVAVSSEASTSHRGQASGEAHGAAGGTWCCELELSGAQELRAVLPPAGQRTARVLVRLHGAPLGYLSVPVDAEGLDIPALVEESRTRFSEVIAARYTAEGGSTGPAGPDRSDRSVSVVVCTRDRSDILADCLVRLRSLTHPHLEILVVDNAPTDERTRLLVEAVAAEDDRFRYIREPRPGLSAARNRGLEEASGDVVAYTDDDVAVDPFWVQGLLRGFDRGAEVGCVTGLVCTAAINSAAEEYFDARAASWSTRCEPDLFDPQGTGRDPLYPYRPSAFGTGANFAFDRELLLSIGGFDEALGAGTLTRGGEDLDVFVRVLRADRSIAYEPEAIVWHHHRADDAALLNQMFGYGTGLSAFITKCLVQPGTRRDVLRRIPVGLRRIGRIKTETGERLDGSTPPPGAMRRELIGMLAGPVLYLRARRRMRPGTGVGERSEPSGRSIVHTPGQRPAAGESR